MRSLVVLILLGLGIWQAVADWRATIGQGYAYRLTPLGQVWADAAPARYESMVSVLKSSPLPLLWDPIGATLLGLPLALLSIGLAGVLWVTRRRRR